MKKPLITLCTLFLFAGASAQKLHVDLYAGDLNYTGDLQRHSFTFAQSHPGAGFGLTYDLADHFAVRSSFIFGKISADDRYGINAARNLNFVSGLTEFNLNAVYYITPLGAHTLTPYVFAGVALFHFNPYTYDTMGVKTYLRPLSTEGEGFLPGQHSYSLTQLAIPFGGGVKFSLSDNLNIGLEFGYRKSFTDYIDDVSGRYVDQATLLANRGPEAVELAYRGNEIKNGSPYPPGGTQRGSSAKKDWYYFTALTASFRLFSGNGLGSGTGRKSRYGCPVNVR